MTARTKLAIVGLAASGVALEVFALYMFYLGVSGVLDLFR